MDRIAKLLLAFILIGAVACGLAGCSGHNVGLLNPKGLIAYEERKLFFDTLALMLIVVLPVIVMSFAFVYHYQISHRVRDYKPNWSHSYFLEALWWGIPCVIILVLAILTWKKTFELDPYRNIPGYDKPLLVQVVALPWKWLFVYPEENIATVNYLVVPAGRQVEYWITADNVPMSGFFIPQLGSQIYAMVGMRTRLHLFSNEPGVYEGVNTQYNGDGFSDMHFPVHVVDAKAMQTWVQGVQQGPNKTLDEATYESLLTPSEKNRAQFFNGVPKDLFDNVIMVYMHTFGKTHPRSAHNFSGDAAVNGKEE